MTVTGRHWLPLREAVAHSGMCANTLRALANEGAILAGLTPGGHRRFAKESIDAYLNRHEVPRLAIQRALGI